MRKNLGAKTAAILIILLVFLYAVFGLPKGFTAAKLGASMLQPSPARNGIHLGLDLRGGTHLILQVMVEEAVGAVTDNDLAKIQESVKTSAPGALANKPDPKVPETLTVTGLTADNSGTVRDYLDTNFANDYDISSGPNNSLTMTMKKAAADQIRTHAVAQAIDTIRDRVDRLGVSEPEIQEYGLGQYQILVELPGVDDPGRVKDIIQSTARLEIHQVTGGPWPDQQTAMQALGGTVPPDMELLQGSAAPGEPAAMV